MDLDRLKTLVALTEQGSVAAAARALQAGESTLRKRIAELEAEVGVSLVRRAGRRLELTPAGSAMASDARRLIADCRAVVNRVVNASGDVVGEYRVATPIGMPPHLSALVIAGHFAQFPGLRLRPLPVASPLALLPDRADIAVTFEPCPADGPWLTAAIHRVSEVVLGSRAYLSRNGTPRTVAELGRHVLLSWHPSGEDPDAWPLRAGGSAQVQTSLASPDILLVRHCMLAGIGLARLPDGGFPDPGIPPDTAVPVLSDVVGRELILRVVMPDTPKMRGPFRQFLGSIRAETAAARNA